MPGEVPIAPNADATQSNTLGPSGRCDLGDGTVTCRPARESCSQGLWVGGVVWVARVAQWTTRENHTGTIMWAFPLMLAVVDARALLRFGAGAKA